MSQHNDTVVIGEDESFNLRLDFNNLDTGPVGETVVVDFIIEVTDVTNDGVVLHLSHVFSHNDVLVTGGGNEDISFLEDGFKSNNLETLHAGL